MKSSISVTPAPTLERTYPYLGIWCDGSFIVLFSKKKHGTVVYSNPDGGWDVGDHYNEWQEDTFNVYTGTVSLEND